MQFDNLVNLDTRTVISGISFGTFDGRVIDFFNYLGNQDTVNLIGMKFLKSALTRDRSLHTIENIITLVTRLKSIFDLELSIIPLNKVRNWIIGESEISHEDDKFFRVIAVDVEIRNMEVVRWSQPMVEPVQEGLCAFVCVGVSGKIIKDNTSIVQ